MKLWKRQKPLIDQEIERLELEMKRYNPTSEEYQTLSKRLSELAETRKKVSKEKLSPNSIAGGVIGLVEVLAIMSYERGHVLATKAFSRIFRGHA